MLLNLAKETDLDKWLSPSDRKDLSSFVWIGFCHENFLGLFVGDSSRQIWEAHWWGRESARRSLTDCRESLKLFFKEVKVDFVYGLTPCENKTGLKMAKLLGFIPLSFQKNNLGKVCLLTRKDR